jgi:hypothetical protein
MQSHPLVPDNVEFWSAHTQVPAPALLPPPIQSGKVYIQVKSPGQDRLP